MWPKTRSIDWLIDWLIDVLANISQLTIPQYCFFSMISGKKHYFDIIYFFVCHCFKVWNSHKFSRFSRFGNGLHCRSQSRIFFRNLKMPESLFENNVGKRGNADGQYILIMPSIFSTCLKKKLIIWLNLILSQTSPCFYPCFENTVGK